MSGQTSFQSINKEAKFFDDPDHFDKIIYQKVPNANHDFGVQVMNIVPKEGEIRLLANRHRDCGYYTMGLDICRRRIIESAKPSFLPCKEIIDSMYRCYTNDSDVKEYHKVREVAKPYAHSFYDCLFKRENEFDSCMPHFENSIRSIYRSGDHKLVDYY